MAIDRLPPMATLGHLTRPRAEVSGDRLRRLSGSEHPALSMDGDREHGRSALHCLITGIACNIDFDDRNSVEAGRKRILRAILLWEYGSQVREYAQWQPMLETLSEAFGSDTVRELEVLRAIAGARE